jgi:hypothetical protein
MKYKCPCCGYYTLDKKPPGTYTICPVCYWEDDRVQYQNPNYSGGANRVSLVQAQKNYLLFGAYANEFLDFVRLPKTDELSGED